MHILIHVNKFYDWEKLPPKTEPSESEIKRNIVKPSADGGWLARIPRKLDTHTDVNLPEAEIVEHIMQAMIKPHQLMTRPKAVAGYLSQYVMPHNAHPNWMEEFKVNDDEGADEALFKEAFDRYLAAGLLEEEDEDRMKLHYLRPTSSEDIEKELYEQFGVDAADVPQKKAARQARMAKKTAKAPKDGEVK